MTSLTIASSSKDPSASPYLSTMQSRPFRRKNLPRRPVLPPIVVKAESLERGNSSKDQSQVALSRNTDNFPFKDFTSVNTSLVVPPVQSESNYLSNSLGPKQKLKHPWFGRQLQDYQKCSIDQSKPTSSLNASRESSVW